MSESNSKQVIAKPLKNEIDRLIAITFFNVAFNVADIHGEIFLGK